ncbi:2-phospho-L-lactate guanylyltransferase [Pseudonocardiaceae bacterium YIM PH 21723]|nr:2-phospho-L-lactate guanylyltransferase [Pseudonocardiaceae bacterium YIM PH 21723]
MLSGATLTRRLGHHGGVSLVDLVIPFKPLHLAKSRLGAAPELALAMLRDTVAAARAARSVSEILIVCSDPVVADAVGVRVVPDSPLAGLNAAISFGAGLLGGRVAAMNADLPALRTAELDAALEAVGDDPAFCPDHLGTGTTLLVSGLDQPLRPLFGTGSAAAHLASGAKLLDGPWPSLRLDVDIQSDLAAAVALGVGPATTAVLTVS